MLHEFQEKIENYNCGIQPLRKLEICHSNLNELIFVVLFSAGLNPVLSQQPAVFTTTVCPICNMLYSDVIDNYKCQIAHLQLTIKNVEKQRLCRLKIIVKGP